MNYFSSDFTLGILGGGQLGKMILQETRKWDIKTKVLDPSPEAPSRMACNDFLTGDLLDYQTIIDFAKDVDVLTIEIENVNIAALETLEAAGTVVYPPTKALKIIANKATQKVFYSEQNIPTAPFVCFNATSEIKESLQNGALSLPFVWKSAQYGYDGQGVKIVRNAPDLEELPNVACIAETLIPFEKELAVIVCRNPSGEVVNYPVVEMEFHPEANQVEYVLCPARLDPKIAQKAIEVALKTSEAYAHVGLLAVEMFLTKEGDILVNEVAPRPHNSGHYSIEASVTNQYEQHLRAILNLPLGDCSSKMAAVMVNLVGAEGHSGPVHYKNIEHILALEGVTPHIYGKSDTRPFRKMGHVTVVNTQMEKARHLAEQVKKSIEVISRTA
ncbi:MAG: 5-(carboxyamino)imidazole ribonucleotide synthase [Flavobacteriaceae bacterium]|nr:5-(carboxyamino)imidazole ribonucleotide synthase [Flavobacteriaceae bacterium]MCI5088676.1 5-(carboxyamino)imidazole ribonucleotide synthase [Flavobacteriaceae bacterium]CAI8213150.1 MAG: N5-carboxyaminoimidazole ribonucleotide synthase [SAR116 cluster bacterium]